MRIDAVVFDLGGVFFSWPGQEYFEGWAQRFGVDPAAFQEALWNGDEIEAANIGAISAEEYAHRCSQRIAVDEASLYDLIETAFAGESPDATMVAYARAIRGRVRVGALTNTWSFGRRLLARHGLDDVFDPVVTSAEEGVRKPDQRIYRILATRLALPPERILFVDDVEENVEAARRLGFHGVRFLSGDQAMAEVDALLTGGGGGADEPRE